MKELIIVPKVSKSKMGAFLAEIKQDGVKTVYADPKNIAGSKMDALWTTKEAKYVIIKNNATKYKNKKIGKEFQVRSNEDIEDILQQAKKGLDFVIIEVKDWKIIPLENIIAKLHKLHTRIFAIAKNPAEVRKMFSILDVGVDGVIFAASTASQVREVLLYMGTKSFDMQKATITEIKEVGLMVNFLWITSLSLFPQRHRPRILAVGCILFLRVVSLITLEPLGHLLVLKNQVAVQHNRISLVPCKVLYLQNVGFSVQHLHTFCISFFQDVLIRDFHTKVSPRGRFCMN